MRKVNLKYTLILLVFVWGHIFAQIDGFNHCQHNDQEKSQTQTEHSCCSNENNQGSDSSKDSSKDSKVRTCVNFASIEPPQNLFFAHLIDVSVPIDNIRIISLPLTHAQGLDHPPRA